MSEWLAHVDAAVGEGRCPVCTGPLPPGRTCTQCWMSYTRAEDGRVMIDMHDPLSIPSSLLNVTSVPLDQVAALAASVLEWRAQPGPSGTLFSSSI